MPPHDCGLSTSPVDLNHRDSHHPSGSPLAPSERLYRLRGTLPCIDSPNILSSSKGQFLRTRQVSAEEDRIAIRYPFGLDESYCCCAKIVLAQANPSPPVGSFRTSGDSLQRAQKFQSGNLSRGQVLISPERRSRQRRSTAARIRIE